MLGRVGVGAGDEDAEAGELGQRRPDLLAVDDPLVAVAHGPGAEGGQVADPAPGSLKSWHQISSPASSGGR